MKRWVLLVAVAAAVIIAVALIVSHGKRDGGTQTPQNTSADAAESNRPEDAGESESSESIPAGDDVGDEETASVPYEDLSEGDLAGMRSLANQLHTHLGWTRPELADGFSAGDLTSEDRAFLLYWYQYNCQDDRIRNEGECNTADPEDLRAILKSLCAGVTDEDFDRFLATYVEKTEDGRCYMNAVGDFGDAGESWLGEPESSRMTDGRLRVQGHLMRFDPDAGEQIAGEPYEIWFVPQEDGLFGGFAFDELRIGNDSSSD